jgi:hypothetical protein
MQETPTDTDVIDANYVVHCHFNSKFKFFATAEELSIFMWGRRLEYYSIFKHVGVLSENIEDMCRLLESR